MASTTPIEDSLQKLCDLRDAGLKEQDQILTAALDWLKPFTTTATTRITKRVDALIEEATALRARQTHRRSSSSSIDSGSTVFHTPNSTTSPSPDPDEPDAELPTASPAASSPPAPEDESSPEADAEPVAKPVPAKSGRAARPTSSPPRASKRRTRSSAKSGETDASSAAPTPVGEDDELDAMSQTSSDSSEEETPPVRRRRVVQRKRKSSLSASVKTARSTLDGTPSPLPLSGAHAPSSERNLSSSKHRASSESDVPESESARDASIDPESEEVAHESSQAPRKLFSSDANNNSNSSVQPKKTRKSSDKLVPKGRRRTTRSSAGNASEDESEIVPASKPTRQQLKEAARVEETAERSVSLSGYSSAEESEEEIDKKDRTRRRSSRVKSVQTQPKTRPPSGRKSGSSQSRLSSAKSQPEKLSSDERKAASTIKQLPIERSNEDKRKSGGSDPATLLGSAIGSDPLEKLTPGSGGTAPRIPQSGDSSDDDKNIEDGEAMTSDPKDGSEKLLSPQASQNDKPRHSSKEKQSSPKKKAQVGSKKNPRSSTSAFAVDPSGNISSAGISALFQLSTEQPAKTPSAEAQVPKEHGIMPIRETAAPSTGINRGAGMKQFASTKKKLLARTPGASAPIVSEDPSKEKATESLNEVTRNQDDRTGYNFDAVHGTPESAGNRSHSPGRPAPSASQNPRDAMRQRIDAAVERKVKYEWTDGSKRREDDSTTTSSKDKSVLRTLIESRFPDKLCDTASKTQTDGPHPVGPALPGIPSSSTMRKEESSRPRNSVRFADSLSAPVSNERPAARPSAEKLVSSDPVIKLRSSSSGSGQSLIVPRTRSSSGSNDAVPSVDEPAPAEKAIGPIMNLVTSVTSFLPTPASILGGRKADERDEATEAEQEAKRQKLDAQRREADLQARREARRLQKQREMHDKKRRAEANRRELEEAEKAREEDRRLREEKRRLRRQREEEERRKQKEEEDRKREERRRLVLQKKKQEEKAELERMRLAAKKMLQAPKPQAGPSSSSQSKSSRDAQLLNNPGFSPAPAPRMARRDPAAVNSYKITPARETILEESDEEKERRRGKPIPKWANTPRLARSLATQADPDDFFASVPVCNLGDVFAGDGRRYNRMRSSSANWARDRATAQEMAAYRRVMGDIRGDNNEEEDE